MKARHANRAYIERSVYIVDFERRFSVVMIAVEGQYMAPHTFVELFPPVKFPAPPE